MSDPTDDALRDAFQALADGPASAPCVSAEEIYDAVAGDLPPERVAAVVDHLSACPPCAEAWRLAAALVEEEADGQIIPLFAEHRPATFDLPETAVWRPWPAIAGLALAALAVFVIGPSVLTPADPTAPVYRDGAAPGLQTASSELRVPRGDVPLAWSGAPEGSTYDVAVTDTSLRDIARAQALTSPAWVLPADQIAALPPGTVLLWGVEALAPTGERIASPTWRIVVE